MVRWRRTFLLLRWLVPLAMAVLGVGFALWDHAVLESGRASTHVISGTLFFGTAGPLLAWLTLNWAVAAEEARARAKEELERRNQELLFLNAIGETASQSLELQEVLDGALYKTWILQTWRLAVSGCWMDRGCT